MPWAYVSVVRCCHEYTYAHMSCSPPSWLLLLLLLLQDEVNMCLGIVDQTSLVRACVRACGRA